MKANTAIHACAVEIKSYGILILGDSGSGKSETVLELINRGHTFIADDMVFIEKSGQQIFISNPSQHYTLHLRDIGIINIESLTTLIKPKAALHIVVQLDTDQCNTTQVFGLDNQYYNIDDIKLSFYTIHDSCKRNIPLIIETIVNQELSKKETFNK